MKQVKRSKIKENPNNPRIIKDHKYYLLVKSLQEFPEMLKLRPIVVDEDMMVLGGNKRLKASKDAGLKEVWIEIAEGLTEAQKKEFVIKDNTNYGEWDWDILANEWDSVQLTEWGVDAWPNQDDIKVEPIAGLTDEDAVPDVPDDPVTVEGDVWLLGNHRLLCGDATKKEDVERLMDGQKADMVFTDPPYGMFLDTNYSQMYKSNDFGGGGKDYKAVAGDNSDFTDELITIVFSMFPYCKEVFLWGADYYRKLLPDGGSWIVWDKRANDKDMNLDKLLGSSFELCWSLQQHKRDIARILWAGHHGMQNCDTKKRVHPTQKPVELVKWFFERWGSTNDLVVDLYGGSGSTLIACEKANRKCYGMEIDPHYCDVIVKRWEEFTGNKAEKLDGKTEKV